MILQVSSDPMILGALCPASPETWLGELGCVLAAWELYTLIGGLALVVGGILLELRRRKRQWRGPGYFVLPMEKGRNMPRPDIRSTGGASTETSKDGAPGRATPSIDSAMQGTLEPEPEPASERTSERSVLPPRPDGPALSSNPHRIEAGQVSFEEPPQGTLQLLPGRLEIQSGAGRGQEVRFVHVPGSEAEITFGRNPGPAYRHVQLESPTVSRIHARLRFENGVWSIFNESDTNPTLVNGTLLHTPDEGRPLRDGDRIEMGEVVFLFHQPEPADRLPFRSSWHTDRGRRGENQDAVAVRTLGDRRELAVVCDGMGAHRAGKLASHEALETLVAELGKGGTLGEAVREANRAVLSRASGDPETAGMGTTLVALLRQGSQYEIANVGDSRAYRVDGDGVSQVSADHSFVAEVVREGRMSIEEAHQSPWRNAVTRHLGAETDVEVDVFGPFSAEEPHLVILCSDGVHGVLSAESVEDLVRGSANVKDMARALGEAALREGSNDNVTAAVIEFGGGLAAD